MFILLSILACTDVKTYDTSDTAITTVPNVGDLIITEIFVGSYIEIKNISDHNLDLSQTVLSNPVAQVYLSATLAPREYFVLGNISYEYVDLATDTVIPRYRDRFYLSQVLDADTSGIVSLVQLDAVVWNSTWPYSSHAAMELKLDSESLEANDNRENWCTSSTFFDKTNYGTPGSMSSC